MGRGHVEDRKTHRSVSLPDSLWELIDDMGVGRSAWIYRAVLEKLKNDDVEEAENSD